MATVSTVRPIAGGKQREEFTLSPQSAAYRRVIALHHTQEIRARQDARRTVSWLRQMSRRSLGHDRMFLASIAKQYGVAADHVELFCDIVVKTIDADL